MNCTQCGTVIPPLQNYGSDSTPVCFSCHDMVETAAKRRAYEEKVRMLNEGRDTTVPYELSRLFAHRPPDSIAVAGSGRYHKAIAQTIMLVLSGALLILVAVAIVGTVEWASFAALWPYQLGAVFGLVTVLTIYPHVSNYVESVVFNRRDSTVIVRNVVAKDLVENRYQWDMLDTRVWSMSTGRDTCYEVHFYDRDSGERIYRQDVADREEAKALIAYLGDFMGNKPIKLVYRYPE